MPGGSPALGAGLKRQGIATAPRYIQKPAFQCQVFANSGPSATAASPSPWRARKPSITRPPTSPASSSACDDILVLPWNERFTEDHVDFIAASVRTQHARLRAGR